jgi:hypothetical protein
MNPARRVEVSAVVRAAVVDPAAVVAAAAVAEKHTHPLASHQDKGEPVQILEHMIRHTIQEGQLL